MFFAKGLPSLRAAGVLLVVVQCCRAPLAAQEKSKSGNEAEIPVTTNGLRELIKKDDEELVRLSKTLLESAQLLQEKSQDVFTGAAEKRKIAYRLVALLKQSPTPDGDLIEDAEDTAVLAEAEEQAAKEHLAAAMTRVESAKADCEESDADLAVSRAELKAEEEPGGEAQEELQAAQQRLAVATVKAARGSEIRRK